MDNKTQGLLKAYNQEYYGRILMFLLGVVYQGFTYREVATDLPLATAQSKTAG